MKIIRLQRVCEEGNLKTGLDESCLEELCYGRGFCKQDKWGEAIGIRLKVKGGGDLKIGEAERLGNQSSTWRDANESKVRQKYAALIDLLEDGLRDLRSTSDVICAWSSRDEPSTVASSLSLSIALFEAPWITSRDSFNGKSLCHE